MRLEGIIPALVTPILQRGEKLNKQVLEDLVENVLDKGVHGVCVLGGTGEYCALSDSVRVAAVETVVEKVNGKVPVIVGLVEPGFLHTKEMIYQSKKIGASAAMVVSPYYVSPTQQGIADYYCRLADSADIPLVLYNVPYRTGVNIEPETVSLIGEKSNIIGIKECSPNMAQVQRLIRLVGDKIAVLSGEDMFVVLEMAMGARGGILASAALLPEKWSQIYLSVKAGDIKGAIEQHAELSLIFKYLFVECNPGPLKAALTMSGFDVGPVLPPLTQIREEYRVELKKALTISGVLSGS